MKRRVVAVVVTWNRRALLSRIERAVNAQTVPPDELIVVDNASTDDPARPSTPPPASAWIQAQQELLRFCDAFAA